MKSLKTLEASLEQIRNSLSERESLQFAGYSDSWIQMLMYNLIATESTSIQNIIFVLPTQKELNIWIEFFEDLKKTNSTFKNLNLTTLPFFTQWGSERYMSTTALVHQRIFALSKLYDHQSTNKTIVFTTLAGLAQYTLTSEDFIRNSFELKVGDILDQDSLENRLRDLGYRDAQVVSEESTFSIRGSIVDLFPPNQLLPIRIEYEDDSIASMRFFDSDLQRSLQAIDKILIGPTSEIIVPLKDRKSSAQNLYEYFVDHHYDESDREGMVSSFSQFGTFSTAPMFFPILRKSQQTTIESSDQNRLYVFPKPISICLEKYNSFFAHQSELCQQDEKTLKASLSVEKHFEFPKNIEEKFSAQKLLNFEFGNPFFSEQKKFLRLEISSRFAFSPGVASFGASSFDKWMESIANAQKREDIKVLFLVQSVEQKERLSHLLQSRSISYKEIDESLKYENLIKASTSSHSIGMGSLGEYLWLEELNLLIIPENILFGVSKKKTQSTSKKLQNLLNSFKDLKIGDLVVHVQHGIGRYKGIISLEIQNLVSDFLQVEYANNDKIYLPVDKLSMLQRYSAGEGVETATLDRLRSSDWDRRKEKVKKAIEDMAQDLLKLQAQRKLSAAPACSPLSDNYYKFESDFAFTETEDQLKAIQEVNEDLSRTQAMDRLICGDVGFGKTEVALRASLRVADEGLQVMVLVPTTILSQQHYRGFQARLENYGLRVACLNRFVSSKDSKTILDDFKSGKVDILIGTHRLLSEDVEPKNLGLLIVDEEQRFGVTHKEKLKKFRASCHILTLTATPIPRTLHMAMVGLRDISIIATPPVSRVSVKTYVSKFDEGLIREAILHEVERGGQVFVVHNRVEDISSFRDFIKSLVPSVDVRFAHGQMGEHKLEKVILEFIEQKFPVLVCTTIIESGIDMPHVNTLIVDRADRFGLAQLYQIRGRVGRSDKQAYAYFLTPPMEQLSDDAQKRLEVLLTHQELGAGFQIASYDLELRGSGNLLGSQQSGHVSAIGLDLYTEMLEAAIAEVQGQIVETKIDTEIKIPIAALIPKSYIQDESSRLGIYKALFSAAEAEEIHQIERDLKDRYGNLPKDCVDLIKIAELKRILRKLRATHIQATNDPNLFELRFDKLHPKQVDIMLELCKQRPQEFRLAPDQKLYVKLLHPQNYATQAANERISDLSALLESFVVEPSVQK